MENPVLFTLAVLTILGMPGPTNTLLASGGATAGLRRSLPLVPAEAAGYLISITTLGLVLGPVVAASPALAGLLRSAVGAYLVLLAVRLWRRGGMVVTTGPLVTPPQVFLTTLLNPKAIVLALGVVPFNAPRVWPYLVGFLLLVVSMSLCWITVGAVLGRVADHHGYGRVVPRVGAAAVGTFAVLLIVLPLVR